MGIITGIVDRKFGKIEEYVNRHERMQANKQSLNDVVGDYHGPYLGSIGVFMQDGWAYNFLSVPRGGTLTIHIADQRIKVSGFTDPRTDGNDAHNERYSCIASGIQVAPLGVEIMDLVAAEANARYIELIFEGLRLTGLTAEWIK